MPGRAPLVLALCLAAACASPPSTRLVDLTHPFDERTVYWPTEEGFVLERGPAGMTPGGYYYEAHRFRAAEHGGTHLDAPVHFCAGGLHVDEIPLERLMGPGVRVDVREAVGEDRDLQIPTRALLEWEERNGSIPEGSIVLLDTGFARFWPDRARYMGTEARGAEGVAALRFPGLHPEAAHWLARERRVHAVGIDTPSIDHGRSRDFAAHVALCEADVAIFENVASLGGLPARGFEVIALPMKIAGGSGGPLRIVAITGPAPE